MDEVFHLDSLRAQLEVLCAKRYVEVLWVEVRCPYDIIKKRLQSTSRKGHILSTEQALKMNLLFEKIFEKFSIHGQNHIVINNGDGTNVDLLVENILKKS